MIQNLDGEIWVDIEGFIGVYQISNFGRVKSLSRIRQSRPGRFYEIPERILKSVNRQRGYMKVDLSKDGEISQTSIHRLVATAFIPNPDNLPCVNHIDRNPSNNNLPNLEWASFSNNTKHWMKDEGILKVKKRYRRQPNQYFKCSQDISHLKNLIETLEFKFSESSHSNYEVGKYEWRYIKNSTQYLINEYGYIISLPQVVDRGIGKKVRSKVRIKGTFLTSLVSKHLGRCQASLVLDGVPTKKYVHILVADAFLKKPKGVVIVNHKDGNAINNHYSNLEWCSFSQNSLHAYKHGAKEAPLGKDSSRSKKVLMKSESDSEIEYFDSIGDAHRKYGFCRSSITNVLRGKRSSYKGYKFYYA